jgi:hypothetical protein
VGAAAGAILGGIGGKMIGEAIENVLFCPTCGREYDSSNRFCPNDGSELQIKR